MTDDLLPWMEKRRARRAVLCERRQLLGCCGKTYQVSTRYPDGQVVTVNHCELTGRDCCYSCEGGVPLSMDMDLAALLRALEDKVNG